MAFLTKAFIAASVLANIVSAAPLDARAILTRTVTETVYTTVDTTSTVWVTERPSDIWVPTPDAVVPTTAAESALTSAPVAAPSSPTSVAAVAPTTTPAAAVSPAGFAQQSPSVAQPAPTTVSTPAPAPAVVSSSAAPAAPTSAVNVQPKQVSSGSATATCEGSGAACEGDVTHWDGGLGACGWNVDTNSDTQVALPFAFMGTQSNGNPYCGRSLTIVNTASGTTVQATVGDKCMGCADRALDLTDTLFNALTDGTGDGRAHNMVWYFN